MPDLRVTLFGCSNTGKTQIVSRFVGGKFEPQYDPTIEDRYTKEACIDGRYVWLKILDTQGLEQFKKMRALYTNNADAFVLVYDTQNEASLRELEELSKEIIKYRSGSVPIVYVGTKIDQLNPLVDNAVSKLGQRLAARYNKPHVLTSAKNDQGIVDVFRAVINEYLKYTHASRRPNHFDSASISSIDGWLYTPSEQAKVAGPQPTLKNSFIRLKKSFSQLKSSKSIRNIRKVVSSASFYKPQNTTAKKSVSSDTLRDIPRNLREVQFDDNTPDSNVETITQNQLESVLEFDDVIDSRKVSKNHGVCSIM